MMAMRSEGDDIYRGLAGLDVNFCRNEDILLLEIESDRPTPMARTEIVLLVAGAVSIIGTWLGLFLWILFRMIGAR